MAYATPTTVYARTTGRTFTASSKPNTSQVAGYIDQAAGELDGILRRVGYALPIATTATAALALLEHYNALGAEALIEISAPVSGGRDKNALKLWDDAKKMLASGDLELGAAMDAENALPRSGWPATAMFSRDQET